MSALCLCQLIFVAQGSCLFAPHPQPPYGTREYTACEQAVAQAFRPYASIFACICCCLFFVFLPIHIKKKCPLLLLSAARHELVCFFYCLVSSRVKNPSGIWMLSSKFRVIQCCFFWGLDLQGAQLVADFSVGPGAATLAARLGTQLAGSFDGLAAGRVDLRYTTVQAKW